jgi:hypothetical protein
MLKKAAAGAVIFTLLVTGAACAKKEEPAPAPSNHANTSQTQQAAPAESQDSINAKAYNAARIAQEKVEFLFQETKDKDGKYVLNSFYPDKDKASQFLAAYFDKPMVDKIIAYYVTDQKSGDAILVKQEPFIKKSLLPSKKEDMTFDASSNKDQVKFTTKDGAVYTMKKVNDKFIVADIAQ